MAFRRPILCTCAVGLWLAAYGAFSTAEERTPEPLPEPLSIAEQLESGNSYDEPFSPNWQTSTNTRTAQMPPDDGWHASYPFKYYPYGYPAAGGDGFTTCLLPPGVADECFCSPPPCYFGTVYIDVLALERRSNLESMNLYFDNTGAASLNTADLNLDTEVGVRVGVLLASPCGNDWMFEYFGIDGYQDTVTRTDALGMTGDFYGQAFGPVTVQTAQYLSKLDSLEFSIRSRQMTRLAPVAGVRYVKLDENFNSLTDVATPAGMFSYSQNDLFGFQFGVHGLLFDWRRWRMETIAKAGPYFNDIDVDVQPNSTNPAIVGKHVHHWSTAFVGDLRVGLTCRLGPRMNFRVGYQALWLDGVAIAPNQNNNISYATNLQTVDLSGVLYQGGYLGLDLSW